MAIIDDYVRRSNEADNGHRVQVTSEPDKGIYDAMNKGLRSIDGSYVCFLNAGDFLPAPDIVSRIVEQISEKDSPAVLYGDTDIVDSEGRFLHHRRLSPPEHLAFPASSSSVAARTSYVEVVPSGNACLSSGLLCPHRLCHSYTLRHAVSLLCRCRLVYPCDESCS